MRSKASQRHKDAKRIARERRNRRCHNMGRLYGNAARLQQETAYIERETLWHALANFFGINRGPRKPDAKDWEL